MSSTSSRWHRVTALVVLGFVSGLPLALTGQAMQAWLLQDGLSLSTIGIFGLVGIPYTFKFLWAPLMDRFEPRFFGRRRSWMVCAQLAMAAILLWMSLLRPGAQTVLFACVAVGVAFLSASQDIVLDAWRSDVLEPAERGLGASLFVTGYRFGMILSGGVALIWADQWGDWGLVYRVMACIMVVAAGFSALALPVPKGGFAAPLQTHAGDELRGFVAIVVAVLVGGFVGQWLLTHMLGLSAESTNPWDKLSYTLVPIACALPLAFWAARKARFATLNQSLHQFFAQSGAWAFLCLIILYKLADAFAGSMTTPFLLKGMAFTQAEVGVANKIFGLWLTIIGGILGGVIMLRLGLWRSLLLFGVLQIVSNLGFYVLYALGKGAWGAAFIPAFNWVVLSLKEGATLDYLLLTVIMIENLSAGMGTAALVALLMALCNQRFSATQFALLSALTAIGRIYVSPVAGAVAESFNWPTFYIFSLVLGIPGMVMLLHMRRDLNALDQPHNSARV